MATIKSSIQLFDNASPALRSMSNALNVCIASFESMQRASGKGVDVASIKLAKAELAKVETNINEIDNNIKLAKEQQDKFNNSIKSGASGVNNLKSGFMKIAGVIGATLGLNQVMKMSDELVSITARLDMIKGEKESVSDLQNKIFQSAQRSRGSYQDTADAIGKMGIMAKDAFTSNDELIAFMEQVNKQFTIAGTTPEGIKASMLQLTQAMGSGVLRGEELNSVFEQAPTIIQSIARYLNVPIGEIRNMAKEGQLTADVVKNALLSTAKETDIAFNNMPKTFGQIKTAMANQAQMTFQPVLQQINKLLNDTKFVTFTNNIMGSIASIASLTTSAFNNLIALADMISNNWSYIAPVIGTVTTALLIYKGVQIATNIAQFADAFSKTQETIASMKKTKATWAEITAQNGLNASLYACPITWIVLGILAIITVIILLCNWIAKSTDVADSAFGVIAGSFMTLLAFIGNLLIGFINMGIQLLNAMIAPIARIIEWIVNVFSGGFDNIGDALKNLLGQMINKFLDFAKIVTPILDAIFGTSWTDKLSSVQADISSWGKNENAVTWKAEIPTLDRFVYKDAFDLGAKWGDSVSNKVSGLFKSEDITMETTQVTDYLSSIANNTAYTADDIGKLSDSMEWLEEDIKYMVDVAERDAINKFTTAEIKVEMTNNNKINSKLDYDTMMSKFNDDLIEVLQSASEGVH